MADVVPMGAGMDPDRGTHVMVVGRKGSGKSVLARRLFDSFPYDKLVLDVTGDITRDLSDEGVPHRRLTDPLPVRFPRPLDSEGARVLATYVPDMGDPAAMDELDRALGLVYNSRRACAWVDEIGELTRAGRTPPNLRRALHHGRHRQMTLIMCGPRPMDIDTLCLAQSDHTFTFQLPNPNDRKRVADSIGWPPKLFDEAVHALGEHEFLWWDSRAQELRHMPALPPRRRGAPASVDDVRQLDRPRH